MINPGDKLFLNQKTSKLYSRPSKARTPFGRLAKGAPPVEEGLKLKTI